MFPSMLVFYKNLALTLYTANPTLSFGGVQQPNELWTTAATIDLLTFFNQPNILWTALAILPRYDLQNNVLWTSNITQPLYQQQPNTIYTALPTLVIPGTNLQL